MPRARYEPLVARQIPLDLLEMPKHEKLTTWIRCTHLGAVDQPGERLPCKQVVGGSIPLGSTNQSHTWV